ncbi:MAG: rhomboid family intramembrane serine protease [Planctomycetes bacterium]|nr:rhomboid family intramembrane serine protease [Planctomycetota bacterium]
MRMWLTLALLAGNVAVFGVEVARSAGGLDGAAGGGWRLPVALPTLVEMGAFQPSAVLAGEGWRLLASAFLHGDVLHLAGNMCVLLMAGRMLEPLYGRARFGAAYVIALLSGHGVALAAFALDRATDFPTPRNDWGVGASAAVIGLVGLFFGLIVRRRDLLGISRFSVAWRILLVVATLPLLSLVYPNVDHLAHAGGLAGGIAASFLVEPPAIARILRMREQERRWEPPLPAPPAPPAT